MGKPKFAYWDLRGRGQPIRFALAYMGVDYDHVIYYQEKEGEGGDTTWKEQKSKLGMVSPNLPYWIDDNIKLSESKAVLMYVVRKYKPGLIPSDLNQLSMMEQIDGILGDISQAFVMAIYTDAKPMHERFDAVVPGKLEVLSQILGANKFLNGNELCYQDFLTYETLYMLKTYRAAVIEKHGNFVKYMNSFESVPAIDAYIKSPGFIRAPCFGRAAAIKI